MFQFGNLFVALLILVSARGATADEMLELPFEINDQNTTVRFQVDSTWHMVKGTVSDIHGILDRGTFPTYRNIRGELSIPVATFNTKNSLRDSRLREIMETSSYPSVRFELRGDQQVCAGKQVDESRCTILLTGLLTIKDITRPVVLHGNLTKANDFWRVQGTTSISWADFGIEDPSIFIARLEGNVAIEFDMTIPLKNEVRMKHEP